MLAVRAQRGTLPPTPSALASAATVCVPPRAALLHRCPVEKTLGRYYAGASTKSPTHAYELSCMSVAEPPPPDTHTPVVGSSRLAPSGYLFGPGPRRGLDVAVQTFNLEKRKDKVTCCPR